MRSACKAWWNRARKMGSDQNGSAIVLAAMSFFLILTITGLVVDGGTLFVVKRDLQKAADAAVLSGAQELTNQQTAVQSVVQTILQDHGMQSSLVSLDIQMGSTVTIHLRQTVNLGFSGLLGIASTPVEVISEAQLQTMGAAYGAAPLGIDGSIPLVYDQQYQLKVDQTAVSSGNFGVLALGGTGANTYSQNLLYGYDNELKVGDILDTQTGNIAGKTRDAIQQRITESPYPSGETFHRDDTRILLVPVYQPYTYTTNQLQQVKIVGFAYFYILAPMDPKDTYITGMFIQRAGTGIANPSALDKGAYAIKLIQ